MLKQIVNVLNNMIYITESLNKINYFYVTKIFKTHNHYININYQL